MGTNTLMETGSTVEPNIGDWRQVGLGLLLPWLFLVALVAAAYGGTLLELAKDWWNDPNAAHGLLVPPLVACIAWQRRGLILAIPAKPDLKGLAVTFGACAFLIIGKLGAEFFLSRISFVLLLAGMVYTFWGVKRLRALSFPFVLLSTMVPLPVLVYNSATLPLQLFASNVAAAVAQTLGVSVYQEGNVIQLANTTLGVAEACSGLRSLSALVVMALLVGSLQFRRLSTRVLLFLLAFPISVFVNVVRVSGTAVMADYDSRLAMGFYHMFSGWLVFLAGIVLVLASAKLLHLTLERNRP